MMSTLRVDVAHVQARADCAMCNHKTVADIVVANVIGLCPACRRHARSFGALKNW